MINRREFIKIGCFILGGLTMSIGYDAKELCVVSDPIPANSCEKIEIKLDNLRPFLIDPMRMQDGRQRLFYDVSSFPSGKHKMIIRGKRGNWYSGKTEFNFKI